MREKNKEQSMNLEKNGPDKEHLEMAKKIHEEIGRAS